MTTTPHSEPIDLRRRKRQPKWLRRLRAIWRDSRALWNEFHIPILTFAAVTVVGGVVYGELHRLAGYSEIALIDRPYTMVQLMLLSPPPEYAGTPDEWYLIAFWYVLPVIFVFIVGNGVVDFVRLFFDRSQRRDAWRQAVAATYRDHVIVLGAGHVGLRVVRVLHDLMSVDVVVIDYSPDQGVEEFMSERRIPLIRADGGESSTLEQAGIKEASAFVACTGNDQANLEAIMRARHMNRNIRIVGRVFDDQFANQIKDFMNVQSVLSSSNLSAPVFAGMALGVDLTQSLSVGGVEYSTMRLVVNPGAFMDGSAVGDLQREHNVDVVLHSPKGHPPQVHPAREATIYGGDILVIFGMHEKVLEIAARNQFLR